MKRESEIRKLDGQTIRLLENHKKNPEYRTEKQQCFIIGSKGIPAHYGGFETFVEKLTQYQHSSKIRYHIARVGNQDFRYEYNGAKCFSVSVPEIGIARAVYYDLKALQKCIDYCKVRPAVKNPIFYVLACRIGPFIRYYKKQIRKLNGVLYVNPDGHEWMRQKWNRAVRAYWKLSERWMVKYADLLICDSKNIEAYIQNMYAEYSPDTTYIAYGTDLAPGILADDDRRLTEWYLKNDLEKGAYYLIVCRFVPENSFEMIIREFMASKSKRDLVIITTVNHKFLSELKRKLYFEKDRRIKFAGTVYDQELLKKIRENAYAYIHGHTVGGTNPSLIEALGSTDLNLLLDVDFNREVGKSSALYWNKEPGSLAALIQKTEAMSEDERQAFGELAKRRVAEAYTWEKICGQYEKLFLGNCRENI